VEGRGAPGQKHLDEFASIAHARICHRFKSFFTLKVSDIPKHIEPGIFFSTLMVNIHSQVYYGEELKQRFCPNAPRPSTGHNSIY